MNSRQGARVFHVKQPESRETAIEIAGAVQRALVARELGELTRTRLPWPHDQRAEWSVLAFLAGATHELRRTVTPDLFFLDLHRAILGAVLECSPNDVDGLARELARRIHGALDYVEDIALRLTDATFTWGEVSRAMDRLIELRDRRALVEELERLARGLRVEALDVEDVRRRMRRFSE